MFGAEDSSTDALKRGHLRNIYIDNQGRCKSSDNGIDPLDEIVFRHRADLGGNGLAVVEEDEARDAAHAVFLRHVGNPVNIDAGDREPPRVLAGNFLDQRSHLTARATPVGLELNEDWAAGLEHALVCFPANPRSVVAR